ncbi:MAG TPA: GAF domain-containing protein [Thermoanaerobaculia bacterium]|nr:GAF domain-containing protein [Thermoanaerobaculia bacterium]
MSDFEALAGRRPDLQVDLVEQLRTTVERANDLLAALESSFQPSETAIPSAGTRIRELEHRLATAESDVKELASRLVESEHQSGRLMSLYVATYQLHASLSPAEVQETIAEIAIDLLGAQRFVLLLRREDADDCEIALRQGFSGEDGSSHWAAERYAGGDPMVDATLSDGLLRLGPTEQSAALAAVPLRVQNDIVGAIVLLRLLDHKPILRPEDRDLLDLLSAHAASALFAARLFAAKDRKLRTLESLVKLARGA